MKIGLNFYNLDNLSLIGKTMDTTDVSTFKLFYISNGLIHGAGYLLIREFNLLSLAINTSDFSVLIFRQIEIFIGLMVAMIIWPAYAFIWFGFAILVQSVDLPGLPLIATLFVISITLSLTYIYKPKVRVKVDIFLTKVINKLPIPFKERGSFLQTKSKSTINSKTGKKNPRKMIINPNRTCKNCNITVKEWKLRGLDKYCPKCKALQ